LKQWDQVKDIFIQPLFLMCDFDGTLTPIVETPEEATLSLEMRERLSSLTRYCPVGIVSGRALDNLRSKVQLENVYYSGNHGYEISGPEIDFVKEEAKTYADVMSEICATMSEKLEDVEGVKVENKKYTASFHYREVREEEVSKVKDLVKSVLSKYKGEEGKEISINQGKKVIEVSPPNDWDKGDAVTLFREVANFEKSFPIYIGDDVTDEHAFFRLQDTGVGILVSEEERETGAHYRLNDFEEVGIFFDKLLELFENL